ncbi:MAG: hypothetical protein FJW39_22750 [Acidobacteria bacterium]|nr:hypothetical protein [Acidobacteriota bacterium]
MSGLEGGGGGEFRLDFGERGGDGVAKFGMGREDAEDGLGHAFDVGGREAGVAGHGGGDAEGHVDLAGHDGDGAEGGGVLDSGARLEDLFGVGVEFLEAVAEAGRGEGDALGEDVAGLGGEGGEVGGPVALEGGFGDTVLRGDIAEGSGE